MSSFQNETIVVLDFETTGISPNQGDRAIEIGAVLLCGGAIADRFQSLINPGIRINSFIESYTGITNAMVQTAPRADVVMREFAAFLGDCPAVAHNASFDRRFLEAEYSRIGQCCQNDFGCSMLAARRIYPDAPNHKLETLVRYKNLQTDGTFHRALADAEMTAHLWLQMCVDLQRDSQLGQIPFALMQGLTKVPKARVADYLANWC